MVESTATVPLKTYLKNLDLTYKISGVEVPNKYVLVKTLDTNDFKLTESWPKNYIPIHCFFKNSHFNTLCKKSVNTLKRVPAQWTASTTDSHKEEDIPNLKAVLAEVNITKMDAVNDLFFWSFYHHIQETNIENDRIITPQIGKITLTSLTRISDWTIYWITKLIDKEHFIDNMAHSLPLTSVSAYLVSPFFDDSFNKSTVSTSYTSSNLLFELSCFSLPKNFYKSAGYCQSIDRHLDINHVKKNVNQTMEMYKKHRLETIKCCVIHFSRMYYAPDSDIKDIPWKRKSVLNLLEEKEELYSTVPIEFSLRNNIYFYECYEEFYSFIYTEKTVAIIPCYISGEEISFIVNNMIDVVLSLLTNNLKPKTPHAILFFFKENKKDTKNNLLTSFNSALKEKINDLYLVIKNNMRIESLEKLDFPGQVRLHNLVALHETLCFTLEKDCIEIVFMEENFKPSNIPEVIFKLNKIIEDNCDWLNFGNVSFSEFQKHIKKFIGFLEFFEIVKEIPANIIYSVFEEITEEQMQKGNTTLFAAAKTSRNSTSGVTSDGYTKLLDSCESQTATNEKILLSLLRYPYSLAIDLLHIIGDIILYKDLFVNEMKVLSGIDEFCILLKKISINVKNMDNNFTKPSFFSDRIKFSSESCLFDIDANSTIQNLSKDLFSNLEKMGIGICFNQNCFILPTHLETSFDVPNKNSKLFQTSVKYKFLFSIDKFITWKIIHLIYYIYYSNYQNKCHVIRLFNNKIVIQDGPVEFEVYIESKEIIVVCSTLRILNGTAFLANILMEVCSIIDFILYERKMFYVKEIDHSWKDETSYEEHCLFENNFNIPFCMTSFDSMENLHRKRILWNCHKTVDPTITGEIPINKATTNVYGLQEVENNETMNETYKKSTFGEYGINNGELFWNLNPVYFNQIDFVNTTTRFSFQIIKTNDKTVSINFSNGNVIYTNGKEKRTIITLMFSIQSTISLKFVYDKTLKDSSNSMLFQMFIDNIRVVNESLPFGYYRVVMKGTDREACSILTYAPRVKYSVEQQVQIGSKMEGWDKKTPSLICASTINNISLTSREGMIHFERWGVSYDYWCKGPETSVEPKKQKFFPLNWVESNNKNDIFKLNGYKTILQAPKDFPHEKFQWNDYLSFLNSKPIPEKWFTDESCGDLRKKPTEKWNYAEQFPIAVNLTINVDYTVNDFLSNQKIKIDSQLENFSNKEADNYLSNSNPFNQFLFVPFELRFDQSTSIMTYSKNTFYPYLICLASSLDLTSLFLSAHIIKFKAEKVKIEDSEIEIIEKYAIKILYLLLSKGGVNDEITANDLSVPIQWSYMSLLISKYGVAKIIEILKEDDSKVLKNSFSSNLLKKIEIIRKKQYELKFLKGNYDKNVSSLCAYHYDCKHLDKNSLDANEYDSMLLDHVISISNNEWDFFQMCPEKFKNIKSIMLRNMKNVQFVKIQNPKFLTTLHIPHCNIEILPEELKSLTRTLKSLKLSNNPIKELPEFIGEFLFIDELFLSSTCLTDLPDSLKFLKRLKKLYIDQNIFEKMPGCIAHLDNLEKLVFSGIDLYPFKDLNTLSLDVFKLKISQIWSHLSAIGFTETELIKLFNMAKSNASNQDTIDSTEIQSLHALLFKKLPRLDKFPSEVFRTPESFQHLNELTMINHSFKFIDESIVDLISLSNVNLSNNPLLEEISPVFCKFPLKSFNIRSCPSLKTPPKEIALKGIHAIIGYLRRLSEGSTQCRRTKLMLVGLGGAGKTSLVKCLINKPAASPYSGYKTYGSTDTNKFDKVTDGIDIIDWELDSVKYSIWDFAGQTVYYNTHQFFLSNRAVYLLVWNVRLGHEHAGLKFWLSSIECHAPKAPVFVIGTHIDEVEKSELPSDDLQKRYSQIRGFYYVCTSSLKKKGINELKTGLHDITIQEKYMDEKIPQAWLSFESKIIEERANANTLEFDKILTIAELCGLIEKSEILQAIEFLHDLGSIQYFNNEFLKKLVVINPQWIVDVMACVVSIRLNAIIDGKLKHEDLSKIWPIDKYPATLHSWLLRLTEEFDLTFQLKTEAANLVPCLLSEVEPEYEWKDVTQLENEVETKMLYKFDYLPSGLFNRSQVRLYQFSDDSVIWKKGTVLKKNAHRGLMKQLNETTVIVRVQGTKPENILFLVHEVFETLIAESFHGVRYDYHIPCPECIRYKLAEPSMIPGQRIRKALSLKVPFLQCVDNFHTLSLNQLQSTLPPSNSEDFDLQLQKTIGELKDIRNDLSHDILVLSCSEDLPAAKNEQESINMKRIITDLEKNGYNSFSFDDSSDIDLEQAILLLKDANVILTFMSEAFVKNKSCKDYFIYAKQVLHKNIKLVLIKNEKGWKEDIDIGPLCIDDVYINMQDPNRYDSKLQDLCKTLSSNNKSIQKNKWPICFLSYCWSNSKAAASKGSRHTESSIGKVDPRNLKDRLEAVGIPCWMDVDQVGQAGLFQDIADGLKRAKIVVACVSDEYVHSNNCLMEFRFASISLRLPIILVVVGTGNNWIRSEIGMLSLQYPRVNLQIHDTEIDEVIKLVKEHLPENTEENTEQDSKEKVDQRAFNELLELAERKLLRQIISLSDKINVMDFPHIPILDFTADDKSKKKQNITRGYRFLFLCEHEEGWHLPSNDYEYILNYSPNSPELKTKLKIWSPYLGRMYAVLRHTTIRMGSINGNEGTRFMDMIHSLMMECEDNTDNSNNKLEEAYSSIMELLRDQVVIFRSKNDILAKCHTSSGKILWLCNEHQKLPRVTILESEEITTLTNEEEDITLAENVTNFEESGEKTGRRSSVLRGKFIGAEVAVEAAGHLEKMQKEKGNLDKVVDSEETAVPIDAEKAKFAGNMISKQGRNKSRACSIS